MGTQNLVESNHDELFAVVGGKSCAIFHQQLLYLGRTL